MKPGSGFGEPTFYQLPINLVRHNGSVENAIIRQTGNGIRGIGIGRVAGELTGPPTQSRPRIVILAVAVCCHKLIHAYEALGFLISTRDLSGCIISPLPSLKHLHLVKMPLRPAVSAAARQILKTAFDELDRTITPGDKRDFGKTTLQDVHKSALEIENQLGARQCLRNMRRLKPFFRGLEHYSKFIEILCNGTPYLPWIWAPVTLVLQITSEYVDAFDQIIKGYASIAESLKRFEILSEAFVGDPGFQTTVAVFYADILEFHKHTYKIVRRSGK